MNKFLSAVAGNGVRGLNRRAFLRGSAVLAGFFIVPRHVIAASGQLPPSEKLNLACIGVGGRGAASVSGVRGHNVVALVDVDSVRLAEAAKPLPQARQFADFRKMFDAMEKGIDAVTVATPDHTHAVAAMMAINRRKHVFCEKPLAHSIHEVRALAQAARQSGVVTQLGNQGHSTDTIRSLCEWVWSGAIGKVHTVHAVSGARHSRISDLPRLAERPPVPEKLDWDLWLGPAQNRAYHPLYCPGSWRNWSAFGCGAIGDWICHVVDPVFWALDLGAPVSVQCQAKDFDPKLHGETFPPGSVITFEFAAKGTRSPVKLVWHDGVEVPPRPPEMAANDKMPATGAAVYGDKGTIVYGSHGAGGLRLIPEAKMDAFQPPAKTIPRVRGHHEDWLNAIRTGTKAGSNFDYGGSLTELALLGLIATRLLGQKLAWDGAAGKFTNSAAANQWLQSSYRVGWRL
jgi:predicted dehydrogenase